MKPGFVGEFRVKGSGQESGGLDGDGFGVSACQDTNVGADVREARGTDERGLECVRLFFELDGVGTGVRLAAVAVALDEDVEEPKEGGFSSPVAIRIAAAQVPNWQSKCARVVDSPPGSTRWVTERSSSTLRTSVVETPRRANACARVAPWRARMPTLPANQIPRVCESSRSRSSSRAVPAMGAPVASRAAGEQVERGLVVLQRIMERQPGVCRALV